MTTEIESEISKTWEIPWTNKPKQINCKSKGGKKENLQEGDLKGLSAKCSV